MRRLSYLVSHAPAVLLAIALASTAAEWRHLVEIGGWFAVLGHFLMVAATLVMLYLACVLALILAALPLVYLFCRNQDDFFALAEARRADLPGVVRQIIVRHLIAGANSLLKAAWYCWWYVRRSLVNDRSR